MFDAVPEQGDGFNCGVFSARYLYGFIKTTASEEFKDITYSQLFNDNQCSLFQFDNQFFRFDGVHVKDLRDKFTAMTKKFIRTYSGCNKSKTKPSCGEERQHRTVNDPLMRKKDNSEQVPLYRKLVVDMNETEQNRSGSEMDSSSDDDDGEMKVMSRSKSDASPNMAANEDDVNKVTTGEANEGLDQKARRLERSREEKGSDKIQMPFDVLVNQLIAEAKEVELKYFCLPHCTRITDISYAKKCLENCELDMAKARNEFEKYIQREFIVASTGCKEFLNQNFSQDYMGVIKSTFTNEPEKVIEDLITDAREYNRHFGHEKCLEKKLLCFMHKEPIVGRCYDEKCRLKICLNCLGNFDTRKCQFCSKALSKVQESSTGMEQTYVFDRPIITVDIANKTNATPENVESNQDDEIGLLEDVAKDIQAGADLDSTVKKGSVRGIAGGCSVGGLQKRQVHVETKESNAAKQIQSETSKIGTGKSNSLMKYVQSSGEKGFIDEYKYKKSKCFCCCKYHR